MTTDTIVVGAGIIGCAAGRVLASAGQSVLLVDPGRPCREASWAAVGMLAAHAEAGGHAALSELCGRSRALFPDFVSALHEETGIDAELARIGSLLPTFEEDSAKLEGLAKSSLGGPGPRIERLDAATVRRLEPWISESCRGGFYVPEDIRVNSRRLCDALVASLETRRVPFVLGRPAARVLLRDSSVVGVQLAGGEEIHAGAVVLAAGAWSGLVEGLPRALPVEPRRGQVIALAAPAGAFRHTLFTHQGYLVPRTDGTLLVGATVERAGFDKRVTAEGIGTLTAVALRIAPRLAQAEFLEAWAGLRPGTPDDLPILGPDPDVDGLFYATGHFRAGILLAPITAQLVVEWATSKASGVSLGAFRPDRFTARAPQPTEIP